MNHLNLISTICLILFLVYIYFMIPQSKKTRNTLLKIQLGIVVGYNILIILIFPYKVPVEFSTLSYFIVPIIVIFNIDRLKIWAVYSALLSGGFYYISMILQGTTLYGHFPFYSVATSLFNHGSLLAFALITLATEKFDRSDAKIIWIFLILNTIWSLSIRQIVLHPGKIFIYMILDANVVRFFFSNDLTIHYVIYYIIFVGSLLISPFLILLLNQAMQKVHPRKEHKTYDETLLAKEN